METTKKDTSLIGCMMDVPNPRALYNQRHKFIAIITIAIMAVICGMDTWNAIGACSSKVTEKGSTTESKFLIIHLMTHI